ncbi:MAG: hydroxyproline-2-epimerase, partial [Planctomycetaceae bacterium]
MSLGRRVIRVIDSHTGGEPTRVIIDPGLKPLPTWNQESLAERLVTLR